MKKLILLFLMAISLETKADLEVDKNNVAKCNQKDADAGMTYAIIACNGKEAKKSDTEMNKVYNRLIADIKKENDSETAKKYIEHLKTTQRAWIKYRDAQCVYDEDGGQLESLRVQSCVDKMSIKRTEELKDTRCEEGVFDAPCYLYK